MLTVWLLIPSFVRIVYCYCLHVFSGKTPDECDITPLRFSRPVDIARKLREEGIRTVPEVINKVVWTKFVKPEAPEELDDEYEKLLEFARRSEKMPVQVLPDVEVSHDDFNAISVLWPETGNCLPCCPWLLSCYCSLTVLYLLWFV